MKALSIRYCTSLFKLTSAVPRSTSCRYLASDKIKDKCQELVLDNDKLKKYMQIFLANIHKGLKRETHPKAIVKCFPTYVQDLPDGTETGKFLALDLGGTNFRVLLIELDGERFGMKSQIFALPQHVVVGPGEQLFDHIAESLSVFVKKEQVTEQRLPLGFTFSFPLHQKGLTSGILERWTKGFNCSNVVGKDVVQMLNEAIDRRGDVKIEICAILNDTTGTLMSCAWKNRKTRIGLIVGTGSNACYMETQRNAEMWDDVDTGSGKVCINLEMGAFGDDGALDFVRCEYDEIIDRRSLNRGQQKHEKMVAGMYIGELVRLALKKFTTEGVLFGGKGSKLLFEEGSFYTEFVSEIESDPPGVFKNVQEICSDFGLRHASEQDYTDVRYVCECISRRSAHLVSAAMATLLNKMGEKKVTIGVDGSVYRFHPHYHNLLMEKIRELCDPSMEFDLMLSEDGSGRGAALVAAVAARLKNQQRQIYSK